MLSPVKIPNRMPDLTDSLKRPIGDDLRRETLATQQNHGRAITELALEHVIFSVSYGPSVQPDLSQGGIQKVVVTDGTAFTIHAPIHVTGVARWLLMVVNSSGGSMGTVTFGAGIVQSGFTGPANGARKSAWFVIDGTNSEQVSSWF